MTGLRRRERSESANFCSPGNRKGRLRGKEYIFCDVKRRGRKNCMKRRKQGSLKVHL